MDNKIPSLSVLMTVYNREAYLADAIQSVLASTYTNFELIILDDASTDNSLDIARKFALTDPRIKVFFNEANLGQFGNRNKAAALAQGSYLKYVDSDDLIYPFSLAVMMEAMEKYPDAALGFCLIGGACKFPLPYKILPIDAISQHYLEGGLLFVGPSGLIIKRSVFEEVGCFEEFGMPSDNHLTLKIASKYPVVALAKDLFWWRLHEGQVFSQNNGNYHNILNNYQYSKDIISNYSPLSAEINKRILFNLKKIFISHLIGLAVKRGKILAAIKMLFQFRSKETIMSKKK